MKMLAAGAEHTTAVTENGKLYGWGWGRYGNLGLGDREDRLVPDQVAAVAVRKSLILFMSSSSIASCFLCTHTRYQSQESCELKGADGYVGLCRPLHCLCCMNRGS